MTRPLGFSRRIASLALGGLSAFVLSVRLGLADPSDRGIGGTGAADDPDDQRPDRGIGGTSVVGTIRSFGSITVNGLKIDYPDSVRVSIDGQAAAASDLRIGHVVRVTARLRRGTLTTHMIVVTSEVVGPVEAVASNGLTVMGQRIAVADSSQWREGDIVSVSGLRRADATIVASLIERRPGALPHVAGLVTRAADGNPIIAGLRLAGLDRRLIGARSVLQGRLGPEGLEVTEARDERSLLGALPSRVVLMEAFVRDEGGAVALGSGLPLTVSPPAAFRSLGNDTHAIVTLSVGRNGDLAVQGVRPEGGTGHGPAFGYRRGRHPGPPGEGLSGHSRGGEPGGHAPNGRGPSGFGSGGRGIGSGRR